MPRILLAGLFHETHSFLDGITGADAFTVRRGAEILAARGDASPFGGVLDLAAEFSWDVLPVIDGRAQPSATVADAVLEAFWSDFVALAGPELERGVDGIYLVLHGAMVTETEEDVEGLLLERLRALPGAAQVPVFGVFDLHANFTPKMARHADCLVAYRKNPHTDAREAACTAARLLQRCLVTGSRPRQQHRLTPLVWPPTGTATAADPMRALEALAREIEQEPGVWSASVVAGFAFADTTCTGVSFVLAGDTDAPLAGHLDRLARLAWELRDQGNVTEPSAYEVLASLQPTPPGLTVLVEPSDNIGGGAPGDGTGLLRALLAAGLPNAAVCLADPAAVATLAGHAPGDRVLLAVGGRGSRLDAGPLELEVELVALNDGRFELEDKQSHLASMTGDRFDMGLCAVVRHAGLTLLLTSVKTPPFDLGQWRSQGLEPTSFSFLGVKAAVAHRRAYDPIATRMLWVDTPGPCSSRLASLPFRRLRRPVWPLDEMTLP
jgi:microcystin degradation protein MlrC